MEPGIESNPRNERNSTIRIDPSSLQVALALVARHAQSLQIGVTSIAA